MDNNPPRLCKKDDKGVLSIIDLPIELWQHSILEQVDSDDSWMMVEMLMMTCHHLKHILRKNTHSIKLDTMFVFRRERGTFPMVWPGIVLDVYRSKEVTSHHEMVMYIATRKCYRGIVEYGAHHKYRTPPHVFTELVKRGDTDLLKLLHVNDVLWEIGVVRYTIGRKTVHLDTFLWLYEHRYIRSNDWFLPERLWVSHMLKDPTSHRNYPIHQALLEKEIPDFWEASSSSHPTVESLHSIVMTMIKKREKREAVESEMIGSLGLLESCCVS